MDRTVEIKACFRQANVKGGAAVLTFVVPTEADGAFDVIRMSGKEVLLAVTDPQPEIVFVNQDGEVV